MNKKYVYTVKIKSNVNHTIEFESYKGDLTDYEISEILHIDGTLDSIMLCYPFKIKILEKSEYND